MRNLWICHWLPHEDFFGCSSKLIFCHRLVCFNCRSLLSYSFAYDQPRICVDFSSDPIGRGHSRLDLKETIENDG